MNHVWLVKWNDLCPPRKLVHSLAIGAAVGRAFPHIPQAKRCVQARAISISRHIASSQPRRPLYCRSFSSSISLPAQSKFRRRTSPQNDGSEKGEFEKTQSPRQSDRLANFSQKDVLEIFDQHRPSFPTALTLLTILQEQRKQGTLDLGLPKDVEKQVQDIPNVTEKALVWLRKEYPLDEDAAILTRIEREDTEQQETYIKLAEKAGIYKPQSGQFGAKRGENDGVYGYSALEELRENNRERAAKRKAELEKQEREQLEKEVAQAKARPSELTTELDARGLRQARLGRSLQKYNQKLNNWSDQYRKRATSDLTVDSPEVTGKGPFRRLFPSFVFATTLTSILAYYSDHATNPLPDSRLFPNSSISVTTVATILALNALILVLWRIPPAWPILTRYFMSTSATPRALATLTNTFSHRSLNHFAFNMLGLWLLGPPLHEYLPDNNRPTFLAIYLSCGVLSSFASLTFFTLRRNFYMTSLGASGAILGVVSALCLLKPDARFSLWILPFAEWREKFSVDGPEALGLIVGADLFCLLATSLGLMAIRTDFVAHLSGIACGAGWAWGIRKGWLGKGKESGKGNDGNGERSKGRGTE